MFENQELLVVTLPSMPRLELTRLVESQAAEGSIAGHSLHRHDRGQVYCLTQGMCVIEHAGGRWSIPPGQIVWIPPGVPHDSLDRGEVAGWIAYLAPSLSRDMPDIPCSIRCSPLVQMVMERFLESKGWLSCADPPQKDDASGVAELLYATTPRQRHLMLVFLDELRAGRAGSHQLPYPQDARFGPVIRRLLGNPADSRSVREWAELAAMSERTFGRLFRRETGMSFSRWRQWLRLMRGYELLAEGMQVQEAAWAVGYENVSSFIAGFRKVYGATPAELAKAHSGDGQG